MLGTKITVNSLDKRSLDITIPAGIQPETILSCNGEGLPNIRSKRKGNMLIKIKIEIPKNLTSEQKEKIKLLKEIK
jgi:molecular chaperone DnaJ